jgi:hypothetical protein
MAAITVSGTLSTAARRTEPSADGSLSASSCGPSPCVKVTPWPSACGTTRTVENESENIGHGRNISCQRAERIRSCGEEALAAQSDPFGPFPKTTRHAPADIFAPSGRGRGRRGDFIWTPIGLVRSKPVFGANCVPLSRETGSLDGRLDSVLAADLLGVTEEYAGDSRRTTGDWYLLS